MDREGTLHRRQTELDAQHDQRRECPHRRRSTCIEFSETAVPDAPPCRCACIGRRPGKTTRTPPPPHRRRPRSRHASTSASRRRTSLPRRGLATAESPKCVQGKTLFSSQLSAVSSYLPLQQIHFVYVDRFLIPKESNQNTQPDRRFRCCIGNDENREHLTLQVVQPRERNQIQVYGIQDQLNRHQNDDHVPPRNHADGADRKQRRGDNQVVQCRYRCHKSVFSSQSS